MFFSPLKELVCLFAGYHPAVIRLDTGNTGAAAYTDAAGNAWSPDSNYRGLSTLLRPLLPLL